jgi:pilus assembly protein CpaE
LSVLSAEAPINQPLLTDGSAFYQLQEEMRNAFETTVLDLPRSMLVQHAHLVHEVHVVIVVVEFTLAATRDAIRILSWLKANAPQARVIIVANRVPATGVQEISRKDFEQSIERKVDVVIPFDPKAAAQAAKLGQPFAKAATAAKVSQPLNALVQMTLATVSSEEERDEKAPAASSLLGKFNFKSLVGMKKEAKAA